MQNTNGQNEKQNGQLHELHEQHGQQHGEHEQHSTERGDLFGYEKKGKYDGIVLFLKVLLVPVLIIGFMAWFALGWVGKNFSDVTLDMMVLQLKMPLKGTGGGMFFSFFLQVFLPSLVITIVIMIIVSIISKKLKSGKTQLLITGVLPFVLSVALVGVSFNRASVALDLPTYLENKNAVSDFIEKNYVIPTSENISFPEEKRNLIYIYMESMESTYLTAEQGGQMNEEMMPELFEIAQNNINFSDDEDLGGSIPLSGMGITSSGIVAQTTGLPLILPDGWDVEKGREVFVSNAVALGDILAENGYAQYFMVGSDAEFGAKDQYFKYHGNAEIFDLFTAREAGIVPADYDNKFWGMEDKYLYEYAKQQLPLIAEGEEPFAFSMLTVDTHFPEGYVCDLCENKFEDQYSNVISCSSHQVGDFINWLKQQDFYENTTVIIAGDHLSMNSDYFNRNNLDVMNRRVYNVFMNTIEAEAVQDRNRVFSSLDMFPTTLASLGAEIRGDRLGLGTNLFSDKPTLLEMYGYDKMNDEMSKKSEFYLNEFY